MDKRSKIENLQAQLQTNIAAIKGLLHQAQSLSVIIESLSTQSDMSDLRRQLQDLKDSIYRNIEVLVTQSRNLLDIYERLLNDVCG